MRERSKQKGDTQVSVRTTWKVEISLAERVNAVENTTWGKKILSLVLALSLRCL